MDVVMPQLGETVTEGVVTRWYKAVGDSVKADETLFDVETDKVSTEIPSPASGIVAEIRVEEGVTAKVGATLAVIRESGAATAQSAPAQLSPAVKTDGTGAQRLTPTLEHAADIVKPPLAAPTGGAQGRLSPVVRKLIAEHGLDAAALSGTGRDGRITRSDVLDHISSKAVHPAFDSAALRSGRTETAAPPGPAIPLNAVRKRVAANMARSWASVPHVLQVVEADFHRIEQARRELGGAWKEREGFELTYLPFVARAVSIALGRYPKLNATYSDAGLTLQRRINLGIAVDLNFEGLVVPVLKDVPLKSLPQLAREIRD